MINCSHFVWYPQSNEILLNLGMKMPSFSISCTGFETNYSACTVHVRAVKIYVAAVEALLKKKKRAG